MTKFIKKPIAVEAYQWKEVSQFRAGRQRDVDYYRTPVIGGEKECRQCNDIMHNHGWLDTLEGGHIVCPNDWIITGVQGEKYPCKPDIFQETYYTEDEYAKQLEESSDEC